MFAGWHSGALWKLNPYTGDILESISLDYPVDGLSVVGDKLYAGTHGGYIVSIGMPDTGAIIEPPQTSPDPWVAVFWVALAVLIVGISFAFRFRLPRRR